MSDLTLCYGDLLGWRLGWLDHWTIVVRRSISNNKVMMKTCAMSSIQILPLLTTIKIKAIFVLLLFVTEGSFQATNALECYTCMHTESRYPGAIKQDLKCVDPVKGGAPRETCPNPNESCLIAVGTGRLGIYGEIKIWVRRCYSVLNYINYRDPEGCYNLFMKFNLSDSTFKLPDRLYRSLGDENVVDENLKKVTNLTQEDALNKSSSADSSGGGTGLTGNGAGAGSDTSSNTGSGSGSNTGVGSGSGSGTRSGPGKQLGIIEIDINGDFCICSKNDLCNKYEEAELDGTGTKKGSKKTTTPLTEGTGVVNEAAPYVIFLLCTFTAASWFVIKSRIYKFVVVW